MEGVIKKIVSDRGFGFIKGGKTDIFFHAVAVADKGFESLNVGDTVEFDEQEGEKGPRAVNVRPVQG